VSTDPPPARLPRAGELVRARFLAAVVVMGAVAGVVGAFFSLLVATVERAAFGFSTGTLAEAITEVSPVHRFATVVAAGAVIAVLWYLLRRSGPPIPGPDQVADGVTVPMRWMLADTVLQAVNVAAGASIGREAAPRQVGALSASVLARRLGLGPDERRLLVCCGAGAGLAAIYDVPFGGTLFTVEAMLGWSLLRTGRPGSVAGTLLVAGATSWLATLCARVVVPDRPTYGFDASVGDPRLLLVALLLGPVLGLVGHGFGVLIDAAARRRPEGRQILWTMPLCYLGIGALALALPLVLGNGHALAENVFAGTVPVATLLLLLVAKPLATLLTVRAGATGGRLTPAFATGAVAGAVVAAGLAPLWPVPLATAAVLGAGAVLVGAMPYPATVAVLVLEFTGFPVAGWPPLVITVAGAHLTAGLLRRR
jgi:H+/Cl- antiporter ClcA